MQNNMKLIFRKAKEADISNIVKLLADDELRSKREDYKVSLPKSYYDAFKIFFKIKTNLKTNACIKLTFVKKCEQ